MTQIKDEIENAAPKHLGVLARGCSFASKKQDKLSWMKTGKFPDLVANLAKVFACLQPVWLSIILFPIKPFLLASHTHCKQAESFAILQHIYKKKLIVNNYSKYIRSR